VVRLKDFLSRKLAEDFTSLPIVKVILEKRLTKVVTEVEDS
jgi:hypothetical protein